MGVYYECYLRGWDPDKGKTIIAPIYRGQEDYFMSTLVKEFTDRARVLATAPTITADPIIYVAIDVAKY